MIAGVRVTAASKAVHGTVEMLETSEHQSEHGSAGCVQCARSAQIVHAHTTIETGTSANGASPYFDEPQDAQSSPVSSASSFGKMSVYFAEVGEFTEVPFFRGHDTGRPGGRAGGLAVVFDVAHL
ncbi:uncharacterized protein EHS24_005342 [Apiotrichum porosum]|uniref:Uncharacterized protein n=1 Tax=Apiotrichum porosum TaxID=105984 RepID=A0A427XDH0_9TREE|nr:uncharacterized protein EHS24_005342 [Apiotrichum porosum]RSH76764.1 hypothetical protein EHS24_005342 [Apiotrichum porosum]